MGSDHSKAVEALRDPSNPEKIEELKKIFYHGDKNKDGLFSVEEWVRNLGPVLWDAVVGGACIDAENEINHENSGGLHKGSSANLHASIVAHEIKTDFNSIDPKDQREWLVLQFVKCDKNQSRTVTFEEFIKYLIREAHLERAVFKQRFVDDYRKKKK